MENSLTTLSNATRMLAEVRSVDDAKRIIDLAEAARIYAKQVELGLEAQNHAAEIKLRAQRKAGEILSSMEKNEGGRPAENWLQAATSFSPTFEDLGIEKTAAHRWQQIAKMPEEKFEEVIQQTKSDERELTTAAVLREVKNTQRAELHAEKRTRPLPEGKFSVIYADPPWQYDNSGFDEAADNQYPTMPLDDICNIPISNLTDKTSVLFLWATNPLLPDALKVLSAWGFEYKTNIAWIKDRGRGKGWFLKSKHELLLIGVKSETPHPQERPDSCFEAERGSIHSRKPEAAYQIIEQMYPGAKIELFARVARQGWSAWGNEEL